MIGTPTIAPRYWLIALLAASPVACHRASATSADLPADAKIGALNKGDVRFAVIGDFGTGGPDEMEVARMVASWEPSFIFTVGDNNLPSGSPADLEPHVAAAYGQFIPGNHGPFGVGPQTPRFFPALGNHDWRNPAGIAPYASFFQVPGNGRYYDVTLADGRLQLFSLDSDPHEPDGNGPDSKQARWLKSRAAASSACLRIVAFHHAAYTSALHGGTREMRWAYREMGIDAVLTGHDHTYERLEEDGIPYFVDGLGGATIYGFHDEDPGSKVRYNAAHGAMLVTLTNAGPRYEFWSVRGEKVDTLSVAKPCAAPARR
jgi:tartrate-resistant acid phosphatase type 5